MSVLPVDFIRTRKEGGTHTDEEITSFIKAYLNGSVPDYQMAAWLMAANFNSLSTDETYYLTREMMLSGDRLTFPDGTNPVDKHSTGGVGDKASLILGPIAAAAGVKVPMITGRGLGHTGGTTDKLESIPGYNAEPSLSEFQKIVEEINLCIIGQTPNICPADKRIYGLRDVTGTVENIPLICASILSKKLSEGITGLVMDVKFGSGAFMKDLDSARDLATQLIKLGARSELKVVALLTSMEQPLGRKIGNALEIEETLEILKLDESSKDYQDTVDLSLALATQMVYLAGKSKTLEEAREICEEALRSKKALNVFETMCARLGGDITRLPKAQHSHAVQATEGGFITNMNVREIGMSALMLGAGRRKAGDKIDPAAGIVLNKKLGEEVQPGDTIATLYASGDSMFEEAERRFRNSLRFAKEKTSVGSLIKEELSWETV